MRDVINSATEWWCGLILKAKTWCNLSAAQVKYGDRLERINGIRVQSSPAEAGQPIRGEASMHEIVAGHWNMLFSPPNRQSFFFDWLINIRFFVFFRRWLGSLRWIAEGGAKKQLVMFSSLGAFNESVWKHPNSPWKCSKWRTWGPCFGDQVYQPRKDQHQESWLQLLQAVVAWWLQQLWLPCIWCSIQRWGLFWIQKGWLTVDG